MNPIVFAMRRPLTVMVVVAAVTLASLVAIARMSLDFFPDLSPGRSPRARGSV